MCRGSDSAAEAEAEAAALANLLAKCTKSTNGHDSRPISTPTPTDMPRPTSRTLGSSNGNISTNNCQQAGSAAGGVSQEPKKQAANRQNMHPEEEQQQKEEQLPLRHNQRQQQGHQIEKMAMAEGLPRDAAKEHEHKQQAERQSQSQSQNRPRKCRSKHQQERQQKQPLLRQDPRQCRRNCNNVAGVQRQWRKHVLWLLPVLLAMILSGTAAGAMTPSARIARSPAAVASGLLIASAKGSARELLYADLGVPSGGSTGAGSSSSGGVGGGGGAAGIECPSFDDNSACPCYKFEDGLFLECPGTTALSLRSTLERISAPIHSLSIYDFDRSVTSLSQDVFQPGVHIRHLQFSHSHLEALKDNSLRNVRSSLESLSIVNGKLTQVSSLGDL